MREKARKSLAAREAGDEEDESLVVHVDVARIESEAKAREEQLKKELHEARKLSDAKGAQIARQDDVIEGLERRVKELGSAQTAAEREAKRAVEAAQKQLDATRFGSAKGKSKRWSRPLRAGTRSWPRARDPLRPSGRNSRPRTAS